MFNGNDLGNALAGMVIAAAVAGGVAAIVLWEIGKWIFSHLSIGWV